MVRLLITMIALSVVFAAGCEESSDVPAREGAGATSGTTQAPPASGQQAPLPMTVTNPNAAVGTATAPGMNPPHGQPNHRCDIPVGSPLSSAPATGQTPPITAQPPVTMQPQVTPQPAIPATTAGMNPPHGQPNHRCDIPVGAPLSSPAPPPK